MKRYWETYLVPAGIEETLEQLAAFQGEAPILAGGTDLLLDLMNNNRHVPAVIDITCIPGQSKIEVEKDELVIGACATLYDVARSGIVQQFAPQLVRAIKTMASLQIRNIATVGGNIANASPAADCVPPLLTADCRVVIASQEGHRETPLNTFLLGPGKTECALDEVIVALRIPLPSSKTASAFEKLGLRRAMAIAVTNVAVSVSMANGQVERARIALGSVAPTAVRAFEAEELLVNTRLEDETLQEASELAMRATSPIDDLRGSAIYRRKMARALTLRGLQQVRDQLKDGNPCGKDLGSRARSKETD